MTLVGALYEVPVCGETASAHPGPQWGSCMCHTAIVYLGTLVMLSSLLPFPPINSE